MIAIPIILSQVPVPATCPDALTITGFISDIGPTIVGVLALWASVIITKRQIRASTISTSRIKWIDELRNDLARLMTLQILVRTLRTNTEEPKRLEYMYEMTGLLSKMLLLLDSTIPLHSKLGDAIKALYYKVNVEQIVPDHAMYKAIYDTAQDVIKEEWSKIKQDR